MEKTNFLKSLLNTRFVSISTKLIILFLATTIFSVLVVVAFNYTYFRNHSMQTNLGILDRFKGQLSEQVTETYFDALNIFSTWTQSEVWVAALEYEAADAASEFIDEISTKQSKFKLIFLHKKDGSIYSASSSKVESVLGKSIDEVLGKIPSYFDIMDKEYLGMTPLDTYSVFGVPLKAVFFTSPVTNDNGDILGYISAAFDWMDIDYLINVLKTKVNNASFSSGTVGIVGSDGRVFNIDSFKEITIDNLDLSSITEDNFEIKFDNTNWFVQKQAIQFGSSDLQVFSAITKEGMYKASDQILKTSGILLLIIVPIIGICILYLIGGFSRPIKSMVNMLKDIAEGEGDLTKVLSAKSNDEIGSMAKWFNIFLKDLAKIISNIMSVSTKVVEIGNDLKDVSISLKKGSEYQEELNKSTASSISDVTASMTELSTTVESTYNSSTEAMNRASSGGEIINSMITSINTIGTNVSESGQKLNELVDIIKKISSTVNVINDITDQTNLLALNATIEAARAGEHGKGFSVVANEVRKLSEKTQKSANEIMSLLNEIQRHSSETVRTMSAAQTVAETGVSQSTAANESVQLILGVIEDISNQIKSMADAIQLQTNNVNQINDNMQEVEKISASNSESSKQIEEFTRNLEMHSKELSGITGKFKVI